MSVKFFLVRWEIEVDAKDEVDAATIAYQTQLDPDSLATVFYVKSEDGSWITVDLSKEV